jgi:hypothetical protein
MRKTHERKPSWREDRDLRRYFNDKEDYSFDEELNDEIILEKSDYEFASEFSWF